MQARSIILPVLVGTGVVLFQQPKCEASITSAISASAVILFPPAACDAGILNSLCSSITGFLNNEAAKAGAAVKKCGKSACVYAKEKQSLIKSAQKEANSACGRGVAPDMAKISAGLDKNAQKSLKDIYSRNSRMFDGTDPNLPAGDFAVNSRAKPTLTGKGGKVLDLKAYEPRINKTPTEFALSGTKLSGEAPAEAATKTSLVASLKSAVLPKTAYAASALCQLQTMAGQPCTKPAPAPPPAPKPQPPACEGGATRNADGYCVCPAGKDVFNNKCVPACTGGRHRNEEGKCECYSFEELVKGKCVDKCLEREIRNAKGDCVCAPGNERVKGDCVPKCSKVQLRNAAGNCENNCLAKCGCPKDVTGCKSAKSKECLTTCEADNLILTKDKQVCLPQMAFCPRGWDDAYWGKTREEGPTAKKFLVKLNLDSLTGHGLKGAIVSWRRPVASELLKYAAEGVPKEDRTERAENGVPKGALIIDEAHNKEIVDKIKTTKAYKIFRADFDVVKGDMKQGTPMIIEKSDNEDLYEALHIVEYVKADPPDVKNNKIKLYFKDTYNFGPPTPNDSDLVKAGLWWQENKWITPYTITITVEDKYK